MIRVDRRSFSRTFFVNQGGDIVRTEDSTYPGPIGGTAPNSAFRVGSAAYGITGQTVTGATGVDTNVWKLAG